MMWNLQRVIQQQFWMKECDILAGSKHTLTPPTYFQGVKTPNPKIYAPESKDSRMAVESRSNLLLLWPPHNQHRCASNPAGWQNAADDQSDREEKEQPHSQPPASDAAHKLRIFLVARSGGTEHRRRRRAGI